MHTVVIAGLNQLNRAIKIQTGSQIKFTFLVIPFFHVFILKGKRGYLAAAPVMTDEERRNKLKDL